MPPKMTTNITVYKAVKIKYQKPNFLVGSTSHDSSSMPTTSNSLMTLQVLSTSLSCSVLLGKAIPVVDSHINMGGKMRFTATGILAISPYSNLSSGTSIPKPKIIFVKNT